jgi:hypothetical protein
MLQECRGDVGRVRAEKISKIIYSISDSFRTFLHPLTAFDKVSELLNEFKARGLIAVICENLRTFASWR